MFCRRTYYELKSVHLIYFFRIYCYYCFYISIYVSQHLYRYSGVVFYFSNFRYLPKKTKDDIKSSLE